MSKTSRTISPLAIALPLLVGLALAVSVVEWLIGGELSDFGVIGLSAKRADSPTVFWSAVIFATAFAILSLIGAVRGILQRRHSPA